MPHSRRAGPGPGFLFPDVPAFARFEPGGNVHITDVARGAAFVADGSFGGEIVQAVQGGGCGRTLQALGAQHPVVQSLEGLGQAPRVELTAANALALDGFDTLFVELVGRCNERCVHCYASSTPDVTAALDRKTCEEIVDDASELGFARIQFTGGDPLLCGFLSDLVHRAVDRGLGVSEIYTNGLALSDSLLDQLAPARPSFAFSFYDCDPDTHDAVTRTPGSQRRTLDAISRTVARDLFVRVGIIIMDQNADHVADTVDLVRSLGVGHVSVATSFAVGRGQRYAGALEAHDRDAHTGPAATEAKRRHGKLCVTYDGDVVPCIFNRSDVLGRVTERRLRSIARAPEPPPRRPLSQEDMLNVYRNQLSCRSCQLTACALQATAHP